MARGGGDPNGAAVSGIASRAVARRAWNEDDDGRRRKDVDVGDISIVHVRRRRRRRVRRRVRRCW